MAILAKILYVGSYSVLIYIGWLMFDFYLTNRKNLKEELDEKESERKENK